MVGPVTLKSMAISIKYKLATMNKNVIVVFAAVCGLSMMSCGDFSDLRPDKKVSVDVVEAGMRSTHNIGGAHDEYGQSKKQEVIPDHDMGTNSIKKGDTSNEKAKTNTAEGADKE